jgi:hypothetical protein
MLIKTLLNRMEKFKGFVFGRTWIEESIEGKETLFIEIQPRKNSRPECPGCGRKRPVHDTNRTGREFDHPPCVRIVVA